MLIHKGVCSILVKTIGDSFSHFPYEISNDDLTRVFISHCCWDFQEVKIEM